MAKISSANARLWARMGSRGTYGAALLELADSESGVLAVSADLVTSSGLDRMAKKYPSRVINTGIAEQNMIGIAAGLANEGYTVFASSFAPFVSLRAGEQIRMNLGYMARNVKAVGLGSGVSMAHLGNSHYGLEDFAVMRSIPGITVICPADGAEIFKTVFAAAAYEYPVYIRLTGSAPSSVVYTDDYEFQIGKAITLREGGDIAVIANGSMVYESLQAAEYLSLAGISASVINMHTVKPLDTTAIDALSGVKAIITVEEHSVIGGLGSAVAEYLAPKRLKPPQLILGLPDKFGKSGEYKWLLERYGLTGEGIAASAKAFLGNA